MVHGKGLAMHSRALVLLAFVSVPLAAAEPPPEFDRPEAHQPDRAQVTLDEDQARRFMDDFARCIAGRQPRKAAAVLALPYASEQAGTAANQLAESQMDCLGPFDGNLSLSLGSASLEAGMAEYFLANPGKIEDLRRRDPGSFAYVQPAGIEAFGECVVAQNPAAVGTLVGTEVASDAEHAATDAIAPHLAACISEGQTLALDRTAVRQLLAVSLYKHVAMPPPPPTNGVQQ